MIERAARYFERVVVALMANPGKSALFSLEERRRLLTDSLSHLDNVEIGSFDGLLVDFARDRGISIIVKGLRAVSDYEYELQMAQMNSALLEGLDTFFLTAKPEFSFLSSSLVKQVAKYGGAIDGLVPAPVAAAVKERFGAS